jgi:hypothetical protein
MFLVDLMHDFELGEWRSLFIHLIRIVEAVDAKLLIELDRRYDPSPAAGEVCHAQLPPGTGQYPRLEETPFANSQRTPQK